MSIDDAPSSSDRALEKWLRIGVLAASALVLGSWLLIAIAHVDDDYHLDHVSGTWMALARYVNHGTLYPPLFNGHDFGGTRYMPLEFVLHGGLAHLTGEYIVSGKLLAYAYALALYGLLFAVIRRIAGSSVLAVGLVAAVLSTGTGLTGSTTIRGDTLPAALQVGAVYLVARSPGLSARAAGSAGLLCALAFMSKLTALWAAIALVAWLAVRDRGGLVVFLASYLGSAAVLFAVFEWASDGRMARNVVGLASAGATLSIRDTVTKFVAIGQGQTAAGWILAPFAIAVIGWGIARRRPTAWQVSLVVAAAIVLPVLRDVGADSNHLIDAEVLTAVVVAETVQVASPRFTPFVWPLVLAAVLWGTLTSYQVDFRYDTEVAVRSLVGRHTGFGAGPALPGVITPGDTVLSEDPYVALSRDENPVVLDAFMLIRLDHDHPDWQASLITRISRHRFTKVVLDNVINPNSHWNQVYSLGEPVARAIASSYRLADVLDNPREGNKYFVYEPR